MSRYFLEVSYVGTAYAGFQIQQNAATIQSEVEKALAIFLRVPVGLTGSSRTDSGVHAMQNYFHFDTDRELGDQMVYNINSLLPAAIAVRSLRKVGDGAHCRFDAVWRQYRYVVYGRKDPFLSGRGYYFPYGLDMERMVAAAAVVKEYTNFGAFAKRNSQVKTYECRILESCWTEVDGCRIYRVRANRFLRGMVRGLVGTMLRVGRQKITVDEFRAILERGDSDDVDFAVPGGGLYLEEVRFADGYFS